jgi:hypothetical protein
MYFITRSVEVGYYISYGNESSGCTKNAEFRSKLKPLPHGGRIRSKFIHVLCLLTLNPLYHSLIVASSYRV